MSGRTPIAEDELKRTSTVFLVLTTIFVIGRVIVHSTKRRNFDLSDFFIYFPYALFVTEWCLYFAVTAPLFRVYAVIYGEDEPYATMMKGVRELQIQDIACANSHR